MRGVFNRQYEKSGARRNRAAETCRRSPEDKEQKARNEEGSSGHQLGIITQQKQKSCARPALRYKDDGGLTVGVRLSRMSLTRGFSRTVAKAGSVFAAATSL